MSLSKENNTLQPEQNTVLLFIGKTGSGKSATGNALFNASVFESRMSSSSVTRVCQKHTGAVHNRSVTVVDTPDFKFSTNTDFDSDSELRRALQLCAAGAHVILLFLTFSTFTEQEREFIHWFEQKFGEEVLRFTLVLFTHAGKPHLRPLGELINRNTQLAPFINRCGRIFHEFNIKAPANSPQVIELMEKIERMVSENGNTCYTLQMLEETEKRREEEKRREKKRREDEKRREKERVQQETEIRVRREYEDEALKKQETFSKKLKHLFTKHRCLRNISVITVFAVATGFVLMSKKDSSRGWMWIRGFTTGGLAAAAGVFSGMFWRLMWKSQFTCSFSREGSSDITQFLLKVLGVGVGAVAGAVVGHLFVQNALPVTILAAFSGAVGSVIQ